MKKFKCLAYLLPMVFLASGCISTKAVMNEQPIKLQELARNEYVVMDNISGTASATQFWFLCFPFGGSSESELRSLAYGDAMKSAKVRDADGLIQPTYNINRTYFTLLWFTVITNKIMVDGKAFRIKTDAELKASK